MTTSQSVAFRCVHAIYDTRVVIQLAIFTTFYVPLKVPFTSQISQVKISCLREGMMLNLILPIIF